MHFSSILLHSAPGMARPLNLPNLAPGLVLLLGPNASGKSTLGRVMRGALWPEFAPPRVTADLILSGPTTGANSQAILAFGKVEWSGACPPIPAEAAGVWYLTMTDLLRPDLDSDRDIARTITRALAGGYDLDQARQIFHRSARPPRKLNADLTAARRSCRDAFDAADDLARREEALQEQRRRVSAATRANAKLRLVEKAGELASARQEQEGTAAALAALPPRLGRLKGDERERVMAARTSLADLEHDMANLVERARISRSAMNECTFSGRRPKAEEIHAWHERARHLQRLEHDLGQSQANMAAANQALDVAQNQVFSDHQGDSQGSPAREDLERLEQGLERRRRSLTALDALQAALSHSPRETTHGDPETLHIGVSLLRAWLACPTTDPRRTAPLPWWAVGVIAFIGLAALAAGAALGMVVLVALGCLISGTAAGVGLLRFLQRLPADPVETTQRAHQQEYRRLGLPQPHHWDHDSVRGQLADLERAMDQARLAEHHEAAFQQLTRDLKHAQDRQRQCEEEVFKTAQAMGLAPDLPDLLLAQQAHRLSVLDECLVESAGCAATLAEREAQAAALLEQYNSWTSSLGIPPSVDSAAAMASAEKLLKRLERLELAEDALSAHGQEIAAAKELLWKLHADAAEPFGQLDLEDGDDQGLERMLDRLAEYQELLQQRRDSERQITSLEMDLADHPDLASMTVEDAIARLVQLKDRASQLQERSRDLAQLEQELSAASEGCTLADAVAAQETAGEALVRARDAAVEDALGRLIIDHISAGTQQAHAPPVLRRAQHWFQRFTRNAFQLDVDAQDGLVALDVDREERRGLHQLSDATRIQLLLASRLAFLEQVEGNGARLPLFLDEALSTSDPARFKEVARCLLELTDEGRQVFYATADPVEADHWQALCEEVGRPQPQRVDLGQLTARSDWADDRPASPPPAPMVPDPAGHDASSYAKLLAVPCPGLHDPSSAWHVLHLLHDQLPGVASCVRAGILSVGRWQAARAGGLSVPVEEELAYHADARAMLLSASLELIRIGRDQPLGWRAITESGAITPAFQDPVQELLAQHGDAPLAFITALADLPRFRAANCQKLRAHLVEAGHLDDRDPLTLEEVTTKAQIRMSRQIKQGRLTLDEASRFVSWIWTVLISPLG